MENGIQHCERERAIRASAGEQDYDKKWGRYLLLQRFNINQLPLPFARDTTKTYEQIDKRSQENRNKKVWTSQPNTGDSKRFCTLNVCFRPTGEQPKLAIIFQGKGKRLVLLRKRFGTKMLMCIFKIIHGLKQSFLLIGQRRPSKQ